MKRGIFVLVVLCSLVTNVYSDELADRVEIGRTVVQLFESDNFNELEKIAGRYRDSGERTSSGLWKLTMFYYSFNRFTGADIKDEHYWNTVQSRVNNWIAQKPDSPTPYIVKGIILTGYAWKYRGGTYANKVPQEAWKPFYENLALAHEHMLASKKIASADPHWYETTAHIKKGLGEDYASFNSFIDEGLDKFPDYYQLYFAAIDYLAPKWHGNKREIEQFANEAVKRTKNINGMAMYARIYWYASQTQYDEKLFTASDVVWEKMRAGIFDVLKDYPDSWNIQNFAHFSCLAKDRDTTRVLLEKMTEPMLMPVWKTPDNFNRCRKFADSAG